MKKILSFLVMFSMVFSMVGVLPGTAIAQEIEEDAKIAICHLTESESNPWSAVWVSVNANVHESHHLDFPYLGPVKESGQPDNKDKQADQWCIDNAPEDTPTEVPSLDLTKTVLYNSEKQSATYTINWSLSGGDVDSLILTDTLPAWTDGVVGTINPTPDPILAPGDLNFNSGNPTEKRTIVWDLGEQDAPANGVLTFKVELWDENTCEIDANEVEAVATYGDDQSVNESASSPAIDIDSERCNDIPQEETATIVATKIVCPTENLLPNWGFGGANITSTTASTFLAENPTCYEEDWTFEWAPDQTANPGNSVVDAPAWTNFTSGVSTSIPAGAKIWVREQFDTDYIPFSGASTNLEDEASKNSAEIYCHTDVLNYDNYDWINPVQAGSTYYCVGFNVPVEDPNPPDECDAFPQDGWYGTYYNYPKNNIGMNLPPLEWNTSYGDPLSNNWTANWYDEEFERFTQVDSNLMFGPSWFPFDNPAPGVPEEIDNGHDYHFGAKWSAKVTAPATANYAYNLSSDDDVWIYVDGNLVVDNSGVHAAIPVPGVINLTMGTHIIDIYFAERHTVQSQMSFEFTTDGLEIEAYNPDCVPPPPVDACPNEQTDPGFQETGPCQSDDVCPEIQGIQTDPADCPPPQCDANANSVIVSDDTVSDGDGNASELSYIHPGWTAVIPGATWIWATDPVDAPTNDGDLTKVFTKTFTIVGTPTTGILDIAADNSYSVKVNGNSVPVVFDQNNFQLGTQDSYDVSSLLVSGLNTLEITATNWESVDQDPNPANNPAGLLFKLSIANNECETPDPETVTVTIVKYIDDEGESNVPATAGNTNNASFPMLATYDAANIGSGTDAPYALDADGFNGDPTPYQAITSEMTVGADYSTSENLSKECTVDNEGQYVLVGYQVGNTLEAALASNIIDSASFTDLQEDKYVVVINKLCGEVEGETSSSNTTVVKAADLAADFPAVLLDPTKWYFFNDETNVIDNNIGSFVTGPNVAPIGTGSAQMSVTGTERKNIATSGLGGTLLSAIKTLSFSTYSQLAGDGANGLSERAPYLHFNVDFNGDGAAVYENRLVYVPGANGVVTSDTWQTWDALSAGTAMWSYSGATWPLPNVEPGTTLKSWNEIITDYPLAETHGAYSFLGFRVGEPYADGFTGNVDNVKVGIKTGLNTHTETYDFEPTDESDNPNDEPDGGSSSSSGSSRRGGGQVLGATTEALCTWDINTYMRRGYRNNPGQVMILQRDLLNGYMNAGVPVDGIYGPKTEAAVKAFQMAKKDKILTPWGLTIPTGIFYKTTLVEAKNTICPEAILPIPTDLINWSKNPSQVPPKA